MAILLDMHAHYLRMALEQAWLGRGTCAPNPAVGAVLVQGNTLIAQSHHARAGLPHAEILALQSAIGYTQGSTLYVTLEPCNHWGKTPPCVNAIQESGVARVVYAYADPNPLVVQNNSPEILRSAGIEVIHYPLPEIDLFYQSFTHWIRHKKPWLSIKIAQSLDAKIAGAHGARVSISNALCAQRTHQHRLRSDVIMTTAHTVLHDNPALNVRLEGEVAQAKPLILLDRTLSVGSEALIWKTAELVHRYYDSALYPEPLPAAGSDHPCSKTENHIEPFFNLPALIQEVGLLGYHDVWVEAGPTLFKALHSHDLVQETYIYVAPKILGPSAMALDLPDTFFEKEHHLFTEILGDNIIHKIRWEHACSQE
ncbi:MAG: bifunctional diaminohydroxyphosphoribosylaminopyrimidine deaminase/5-amino-6-(5-phosphoribosylamino)uracil reductase RibD [Legionellaceae bacterium]|nr:bifunctional diaminohydroxyphosphoribosylaminopyrimidine deaminase/5-amino-6-(5-phosphoribosylamino)uracil reductase RibD [Legionellaceae bacterium]